MSKTYRIGSVAKLLGLQPYVLRFWETEFPELVPPRTAKGQRVYTEEYVAKVRLIQELLHEQGLTIDGARKVLAGQSSFTPAKLSDTLTNKLPDNLAGDIIHNLRQIQDILKQS